ncbi:protein downstream neighbor of son homolog [Venturia canescens]|uniref:protein downstream neighbor of son homolog n=1 Tax=Venturia canescens TaxID=32260 RepID=UPI001C9CC85A|nr:protein downstream neighbor of son homolog [Venturia canescens]XP_043267312.1 protein downstream neighbor of son homolog [Venturia canescens]XP_043267313.1 protein downstream neighbor of son homolog [Venturia canescens]
MGDGAINESEWKRPNEVMQLVRLKNRKRALQARMNRTAPVNSETCQKWNVLEGKSVEISGGQKRKNPFAMSQSKKKSKDEISTELETSNDSVLFELMHSRNTSQAQDKAEIPSVIPNHKPLSFESVLTKLEGGIVDDPTVEEETETFKGLDYFPVDWSLKTKMRIMSPKPFSWNGKPKTSEEASGTTGFVRCVDIGEQETTLDTSPNARFHQCCLVWQHPSLPWLDLFPRTAGKVSASIASNSVIAQNQFIKDALFAEWSESFRSLFHLLRARQCPYFYVCTNTFTVLYRAAGICGLSEVHAFLTPTTRGFRQALKQEDIEYTMPLRKDGGKRRSDVTDSGCETLDSCLSEPTTTTDEIVQNEDDEDNEEQWLQSLGIADSEIRRINTLQARKELEKESEIDTLKQSLVFVKGVEAQALFNFLINCKSAVATTGALAGVPPTLLSPVAFHGATLRPIKVRESIVRLEKDRFYSLELRGPLLPHVLPSICNLMRSSQLDRFTISSAQLSATTSFSIAGHGQEETKPEKTEKVPQSVFGQENLSDCGFSKQLLSHFCNPDPRRIQILETLNFSNDKYTWS